MARRRATAPDPVPKAIVASAKRMKVGTDQVKRASTGDGWQSACWHFYNTVGEYAYAVNWVGNLLSRAKLYVTRDTGDGPRKVESNVPAAEALSAFFYNEQGRSTCLQQIGVHYTVAGECYVVGTTVNGVEEWEIVASTRITGSAEQGWKIDALPVVSQGPPLVIRIWRPHPVQPRNATSPSRAALPILSEIESLTMHVAAQVDSRLTSAGILLMPNEMSLSVSANPDGSLSSTADILAALLADVASRSIADRGSAEAKLPIIITADGDVLDKAKHLTFWTELDRQAVELRVEAIRRLALSMDMPPEILTGQGDTNHWSAWSIDESAIKSHTEPLLARIADDLAVGFLRPWLEDQGMDAEEAREYGIGLDTTEMRLRPNRSQEALELWDRGVLSIRTLLEETGFKVDSYPDAEELRQWFQRKVASGQTTPELVEAALERLGVDLDVQVDPNPPEDRPEQQEARPTPSLEDHPDTSPPDPMRAAMLAGCEVMVHRALERAGNRLKSKMQSRIPGVKTPEMYLYYECSQKTTVEILEDAWGMVDYFAPKWGISPDDLRQSLDSYCRAIILERKPHNPELMASFVSMARAV